ncbi:MAG: PQQ-binding-like beta-propeller repeat protein [Planctomycetota bacterium]
MTRCSYQHTLGFMISICLSWIGFAQAAPLGPTSLEGLGMVRSWTAQTVAARGEGMEMNMHLSNSRFTHVFDVVTADGVRSFVEGTLGPQGQVMTKEEAERQADIAMRMLKLEGIEASVKSRQIPELTILVQSPTGRVEAIDAETGRIKWQLAVGEPDLPGAVPTANENYTASLSGSTLYVTEIATGKLVAKHFTRNIPGGSPTLTESHALVPLYRGAMEAVPLDPELAKAGSTFLSSFGSPTARPTLVGDILCWPTDRGAVYFADGARATDLFRVRTRDRIVGQVAYAAPHSFFVGTEDGYLICIDDKRESIVWDYLMGTPAAGTPYVLGDMVFVVTTDGMLHGVDAKLGVERWTRRGVRRTAGGIGNRLICEMFDGTLAALDVANGEALARVPMPRGAKIIDNAITDRLYLAEGGRISCYRDADEPWPTIYFSVVKDKAYHSGADGEDEPDTTEETAEASMGAESAADNPFATDSPADGEDPFGGDSGADDDPFGESGSGDDDPFGGDSGADEDPFG